MRQPKNHGGWGIAFSIFFIFSIFFLLGTSPLNGFAEDDSKIDNKVSFDAQAVLPENQQSEASYYDLKVAPGSSQKLVLKLRNTSTKDIKVNVEANNGITNQNGAIDYSKHGEKLLGGPSFEELISKSQKISLKPEEEKDVTFELKIPKAGFDGTVLGGFYCYEDTEGKEEQSTGFTLNNKFAYTIGAKLICSGKKVQPDFALTKVTPGLDNGYLTVFADLENSQPILMSKLDMHATVTKKGQKDVLKEMNKKVSFAPRTKFSLPISWNNDPLKKGTYELVIDLKNDEGKTWQLKKDFEIKGKDEELNTKAVEVNKEKDNTFIYVIAALFLVIILVLVGYIYNMKRKKQ